ncbi:carbonic anhydrase family protein [Cyclobacterium marinum]|uniref:carbonic anhydrase n=1 Tax=Cyclobacterium marinum (strain ATCC 25205 / DSM 745 / LMG 13164 / NCIMB 1802) TaxID=880070 RepID=G0J880_CYCMS|nr:carbonic anhydrase family protein [Cyclobacterium marinum]AEL27860.1 carbonic anhydrase [Cyclobacterium marinum DSM 745]MBI0397638.1 carbonic anhydrase [Cyclobacterium marinum]MBR9777479.1 carbonic anhydrase [Cytophagales bacterium]|tara:strand:- start:7444 stop:8088 length:645 start_codon:yes stop_codon:yes gene_type:complete
MKAHTAETQATMTPAKALEILQEGNQRFVSNLKVNRNLLEQVNATKDGQFPFAIVLSCIDSRTSAELIFDQGLGDIFSVRIAGNVLNKDILGSMEFACKLAGSKQIVVLGHSKCGAIKGACAGVKIGNLSGLLEKIDPAIGDVASEMPDVDHSDPEFIRAVEKRNVITTMDLILQESPVLKELYENGEIGMTGGYYDVDTGEVTFMKAVLGEQS